ncbi:zinc-ribbon domain-containing protein [Lysinibacillus sphaericus]|uniref:zinc-ribbon domain-containing protein n=1 Tax=Lysinibacillus sphaericus TaxID=1421 RepID=UPI0018CE3AC2|nr:zinc-ribbon domain-containing protein [Lysinibacillus sphaericus]
MVNLTNIQFNRSIDLKDNAMLKHSPHLFEEWDFEKNNELGLDIYSVTKSSSKKAWWKCLDCKSSYNSQIRGKVNGSRCLYCLGRKVNHTNSLASLNPELAKEWHPTMNGDLTPHDVTVGNSRIKVWWQCELGHDWEMSVNERKYCGCPYCSGHKIMKGFNDINTTSIKLKNILLNSEDGYNYSKGSKVKLNWKCQCGQVINNKSPFIVYREGLGCPNCSDGKSYPEKFIYHLLKQLNIKFKWEMTFKWSQSKRYDFYIPLYNMIIEVHGEQHYVQTNRKHARSLQEEQENDRLKEKLAKDNGIEHYIVIDARESNITWMKNSILSSSIPSLLNCSNVNFENIDLSAKEKVIDEMKSLWNKNKSIKLISKVTGLDRNAVVRYLKTVDAFDNEEDVDYIKKNIDSKRIIEIDLNTSLIKEWESTEDITDGEINISTLSTIRIFKEKYFFKRDYFITNMDKIKNKIQEVSFLENSKRKIYQLDYNFDLVKVWRDDRRCIAEHFNLSRENFDAHLRGEQLSFANYLWCYDDELKEKISIYKEMLNNKFSYLIYQFNLDGELIKQWRNNTNTELYDEISINFKHLKKKVLDKTHYYKGFIFLKSFKYEAISDKEKFFKEMESKYKN